MSALATIDVPSARETLRILEAHGNERSVQDYLEHLSRKDRVTVVVNRALRPQPFGRTIHRVVHEEEGRSLRLPPALLMADEVRAMLGEKPKHLREFLALFGGELVSVTPNLRTTVGIDYVAGSLGDNAARPAVARFLALSESATAPAAADTVVAGEITTGGLARVAATYAHTGAATNYTYSNTFTATAAFTAVQKAGLLTASTVGTLYVENTFTATALAINDQLTVTWTLNF